MMSPPNGGLGLHGRFVAFTSSAANLVAGDTNGVADVFIRDTCIGQSAQCVPGTVRVSLTSEGRQIVGQPSRSAGFFSWDGEAVAFATAAAGVVAGDTNGVADVFLRQVYNGLWTTVRFTVAADGADANGASRSIRLNHHPFGPDFAAYVSEATNLVPGEPTPVVVPQVYRIPVP